MAGTVADGKDRTILLHSPAWLTVRAAGEAAPTAGTPS